MLLFGEFIFVNTRIVVVVLVYCDAIRLLPLDTVYGDFEREPLDLAILAAEKVDVIEHERIILVHNKGFGFNVGKSTYRDEGVVICCVIPGKSEAQQVRITFGKLDAVFLLNILEDRSIKSDRALYLVYTLDYN